MSGVHKGKGDKMFKLLVEYTLYAPSENQLFDYLTESDIFKGHRSASVIQYVRLVHEDYEYVNHPDERMGLIRPSGFAP